LSRKFSAEILKQKHYHTGKLKRAKPRKLIRDLGALYVTTRTSNEVLFVCDKIYLVKIQVITLFPEMFAGVLGSSMLWKAQDRGIVTYEFINLRDFGLGPRKQVDDTPYGGGDGMLLKPEPVVAAIELAKQNDPEALVLLPTPRGEEYKQSTAKTLAASAPKGLIIVCPRYEGYDERITKWIDKQYCIGSYVLTGGELPAMILIDSVVRLLPGVLGGETSAEIESFQDDDENIEFPQYTRPEDFRGMKVPEVLLNGHHAEIAKWRSKHSHKAEN
jgi:tRNA (guanine37-N1)-methyltransferase